MTILQILIAAVVGVAAGFGSSVVLPDSGIAPVAIGAVAGLLTLLTQVRFARSAPRINLTPTALRPQFPPRKRDNGKQPPLLHRGGTADTAARQAQGDQPVSEERLRKHCSQGHLDVNIETIDGTTKIVVTAHGYTGSEWKNRIRPALERVRIIKWEFPKNLHDGRRQMTGTSTGNPEQAAAALRNIG